MGIFDQLPKVYIKEWQIYNFNIYVSRFAQDRSYEPVTFYNVPPDTFECMENQLIDHCIDVPHGNSGELSSHGIVHISYGIENLN